jgi:predicted secreted hydrolase
MSRRILTLGSVFLAAVVIAILVSVTAQDTPENEKSTPEKGNIFIKLLRDADISGFPKVLSPRAFSFPADHGPHPEHRLEWWYYTGNLETETGRHFGY